MPFTLLPTMRTGPMLTTADQNYEVLTLPIDQYPYITPPAVRISTSYPGATAVTAAESADEDGGEGDEAGQGRQRGQGH